jgi:hypothetical protein
MGDGAAEKEYRPAQKSSKRPPNLPGLVQHYSAPLLRVASHGIIDPGVSSTLGTISGSD